MVYYQYCMVPECKNTTVSTPAKTFVKVPMDEKKRKTWLKAARRNPKDVSAKSNLSVCEDHFTLEDDMENYMEWKMMRVQKRMKKDVVPHKFACQKDRERTLDHPARDVVLEHAKLQIIQDALFDKPSTSKIGLFKKRDNSGGLLAEHVEEANISFSEYRSKSSCCSIQTNTACQSCSSIKQMQHRTTNIATSPKFKSHIVLDRKELDIVSLSDQKKMFLFDINARSIANSNLTQNIVDPQNMCLNNLTEDKDNIFEEVPLLNLKSESLKEEDEIEIKEENVGTAADTMNLESIDRIQQTEIASNASENMDNVFEEVPYIANILNVKSELLKEEDEIEIKEEKLFEFIESDANVGKTADTMTSASIGRIQQTEITLNASEDMDNVFEKVPYIANILNVKSDSLKEEDEIEIKEENEERLYEFIESDANVGKAADTMNLESIGRIHQTKIMSNASEILINKTENMCHSIQKCPSQPGIDTEQIIHASNDDILKKILKKRKLRMQPSTDKEEQFLLCDKLQWNRHSMLHNDNGELHNCSKHVYSTTKRRNMQSHMRKHGSEHRTQLLLKCKKCPYKTIEEVHFELHLKAHQSKKKILKCSECYYITTCSNSLKNHMETHESKPKTFKCQKCDYVTGKHTNLVSHMLSHQENYNFQCPKCSYQAKRKTHLIRHMLIHQDNCTYFRCQKCSYQTKRKIDLVRHMLTHQENYNFKCHKCNYQTKIKTRSVRHMQIHQDNYNFKCQKCSYQTKRKANLVSHMLIHQDNCNFQCHKCRYQTKRKTDLIRHMLIHQDNCKFQCHECSYQTKRKGNLVGHMLIHQDNYNFKCQKCSYQTKRKINFITHMLIHQDNYNFQCHNCSYQAKRKGNLIRHMSIHQDN